MRDLASRAVQLNFDGGEGEDDEALAPHVTAIHIACGGHAGDEASMRRALALARTRSLACGAHPSYPDREGFGRKAMVLPIAQIADVVRAQVGALATLAREEGVALTQVKPHGALYHDAAHRADVAEALVSASLSAAPGACFVTSPGSLLIAAAARHGSRAIAEGFADRRYLPDGGLVSRSEPDALLLDPEEAATQALSLVLDGAVTARDGSRLRLLVEAICIHGDTPGAPALARLTRERLLAAGVSLRFRARE